MKKIIALIAMLIALALSGSPALFADSGVLASDHHALQGVIMRNVGNCQTCHEAPADQTVQRQQNLTNVAYRPRINPAHSTQRQWGIKPRPYYRTANWTPD